VAEIVSVASDIALVVEDGIVKDVSLSEQSLIDEGYGETWPGMAWVDTVTVESRPKIEDLLNRSQPNKSWRQVNHASQSALDVPIKYTTIPVGEGDRFIVLGRELSRMAVLQQKLMEAHQNLERDYGRMRRAEGRYRLLFNSSAVAILILNPADGTIEDMNTAATNMIGRSASELTGTHISDLFEASQLARVNEYVGLALAGGKSNLKNMSLKTGNSVDLAASAFREEQQAKLILRFTSSGQNANGNDGHTALGAVIDELPDALVLADSDQRIISVNGTFVRQSQLSSPQAARGDRLHTFLGRSTTDLNVMFSTLKNHGSVRNFATVFRDRFGVEDKVEVSAVAAPSSDGEVYAFAIRGVSRRIANSPGLGEQLPNSTTDFTELVGRVPLKDIVRESTILIERLCIEAALEISNNNRASAAEMLGLSRQGLYSKLKRGGIDNSD
jgi:transcriptional regulator PpsR